MSLELTRGYVCFAGTLSVEPLVERIYCRKKADIHAARVSMGLHDPAQVEYTFMSRMYAFSVENPSNALSLR